MSMEEMLEVLNKKGSGKWTMRDSYWYGDYLNCRPEEDVRVRIHQPAEFYAGITRDPKDLEPRDLEPRDLEPRDYYTATFIIESKAAAARDAVDHIFRELLV